MVSPLHGITDLILTAALRDRIYPFDRERNSSRFATCQSLDWSSGREATGLTPLAMSHCL